MGGVSVSMGMDSSSGVAQQPKRSPMSNAVQPILSAAKTLSKDRPKHQQQPSSKTEGVSTTSIMPLAAVALVLALNAAHSNDAHILGTSSTGIANRSLETAAVLLLNLTPAIGESSTPPSMIRSFLPK